LASVQIIKGEDRSMTTEVIVHTLEPGEMFTVDFTYEGFEITTLMRRTKDGFEIIHHEMPDEAMRLSFSRMDDLAIEAARNV
jgi:hypothetical protein